jgi:hypothetical protein
MATRNYWRQQKLSILFTGVFRNTAVRNFMQFYMHSFFLLFPLEEKGLAVTTKTWLGANVKSCGLTITAHRRRRNKFRYSVQNWATSLLFRRKNFNISPRILCALCCFSNASLLDRCVCVCGVMTITFAIGAVRGETKQSMTYPHQTTAFTKLFSVQRLCVVCQRLAEVSKTQPCSSETSAKFMPLFAASRLRRQYLFFSHR